MRLQQEAVAVVNQYRYLGVTLTNAPDYCDEYQAHIRQTAQRGQNILRRRILWSGNRYLMVRELWKAVHVPGITFANEIICVMADTRAWLERRQRDVGRQALGCHGQVAIEAIQGDVGWSTFEAREAASKLCYRGRLLHMDKSRWARRIFDYLGLRCLQTRWVKRVYQLRKKNGFFTDPVQEDSEGKWTRGRVRDAETAHWMEEAGKKSTLDVYRAHKHNIRAEDFYDNSLGSRLLFEARAGALRTLAYRQRFDPTIMTIQCRLCDQEAETIEHLVLRCPALTPKWELAWLADTQADQASSLGQWTTGYAIGECAWRL